MGALTKAPSNWGLIPHPPRPSNPQGDQTAAKPFYIACFAIFFFSRLARLSAFNTRGVVEKQKTSRCGGSSCECITIRGSIGAPSSFTDWKALGAVSDLLCSGSEYCQNTNLGELDLNPWRCFPWGSDVGLILLDIPSHLPPTLDNLKSF